jgi:hypothetical protein
VAGQTIAVTQTNAAAAPPPPPNLRFISRAEQGPSFGDQSDEIGPVAASSEDAPLFTNGGVAAIAEREREEQTGCRRPMGTLEGFTDRVWQAAEERRLARALNS